MKVIAQRVEEAKLYLKEGNLKFIGKIKKGLLVFIGIEKDDNLEGLYFLADKIANLRVFEDNEGRLQYSVKEKKLEIMLIPNFTLCSSVLKGRRPSFDKAASKDKAKEFFGIFTKILKEQGINCKEGIFGASMVIEARNWGPVNIILEK